MKEKQKPLKRFQQYNTPLKLFAQSPLSKLPVPQPIGIYDKNNQLCLGSTAQIYGRCFCIVPISEDVIGTKKYVEYNEIVIQKDIETGYTLNTNISTWRNKYIALGPYDKSKQINVSFIPNDISLKNQPISLYDLRSKLFSIYFHTIDSTCDGIACVIHSSSKTLGGHLVYVLIFTV